MICFGRFALRDVHAVTRGVLLALQLPVAVASDVATSCVLNDNALGRRLVRQELPLEVDPFAGWRLKLHFPGSEVKPAKAKKIHSWAPSFPLAPVLRPFCCACRRSVPQENLLTSLAQRVEDTFA